MSASDSKPIELRPFSTRTEWLINLGAIGVGIIIILGLQYFVRATGRGLADWAQVLVLIVLLGIFGGAGKGIWKTIQYGHDFTDPPTRAMTCPTCQHVTAVNVRQLWFNCQNCDDPIHYATDNLIGHNRGMLLALHQQGYRCTKCSHVNSLLQRPAWYRCPQCKTKVDLEQVPL